MTPDTIKNIVMIIILLAGMVCLMRAKITFQQRQQTAPDNAWSESEKKLRIIGYSLMILDVLIAGFVRL